MPGKTLTLEQLQQRLAALVNVADAEAAIGVRDFDVATYARVLEYGSVAGRPPWATPGPRTTLAVDPHTGAQVVVSTQAPQGFIRLQAPQFPAVIAEEMRASLDWLDSAVVQSHIAEAARRSAQEALQRLRAAAPRQSGRLAESLEVLSE
jgi:hypothetical protein